MLSCMARSLIALALVCGSAIALACKPGEQFNARFFTEADQLAGAEAGRLGAWVAEMQRSYPKRDLFILVSYVKERGASEAIAKRRADWIKDFLVSMGEEPKTIVYGGATVRLNPTGRDYSGATDSSVAIEFGPGCPNRCCKAKSE